MGATMSPNGTVRKSLSAQIDRLDSLLDGLADGLNDAVAAAVKEAVTVAVGEAVTAVLHKVARRPDLVDRLRPDRENPDQTEPCRATAAKSPADECSWVSAVWTRLMAVLCACGEAARNAENLGATAISTAIRGTWGGLRVIGGRLAGIGAGCRRSVGTVGLRVRELVPRFRRVGRRLLLAAAVGTAVGVGGFLTGPWVAAVVAGISAASGVLGAGEAGRSKRAR